MKTTTKIFSLALATFFMAPVMSHSADWQLRSSTISPNLAAALDATISSNPAPLETASVQQGAETIKQSAKQSAHLVGPEEVVIVKQKYRDIIQFAATRSNMNVDISRGVRGTAQNVVLPSKLIDLLEEMAYTNDIVWYRKNRNIYVSSAKENKSRLIFLGETSLKRFKNSIKEAGIVAPNFEFEYLADAQSVSVVGPISYLASLELIAQALNKSTGSSSVVTIKAGVVSTIRR